MLHELFRIILLGAPASGKGTVAKRIQDRWTCEHIAPGDILRLNIQKRTKLGVKVEGLMKEGQLVPDELILRCLKEYICKFEGKSLLFDGFPRTVVQAHQLPSVVGDGGREGKIFETVVNIVVPHDVIIERTQGRWVHLASGRVYNTGFKDPKVPGIDDITGDKLTQRNDDKPEVVRKRLKLYEKMIMPVISYYQQKGLLQTYEGRTTAEIWPQIERYLQENLGKPLRTEEGCL